MKSTVNVLGLACAIFVSCFDLVSAQGCIASLTELTALQEARGNTNTVATYVMCPNTVYVPTDYELFELNGNANYLCGTSGSSSNNCIVRGGAFQLSIALYPYGFSKKDNILISGFTFEQAEIANGAIAAGGNYTVRDCIFRNNNNHGVIDFIYYIPPTLRRELSTPEDKKEMRDDYFRFLTDPHLRLERMRTLEDGEEASRSVTLFDRCQFLNNTMTYDVVYPSLLNNGPLAIISSFADVTVNECVFKDNFHEFRRDHEGEGYTIYVESGSTLNVTKSCFVNNYVDGYGPIWIRTDSSFALSSNNYLTDPEPISPCEYLFLHEAWKCKAAESNVCLAPACNVGFKVFNARTQTIAANLTTNGMTITAPPCNINIEAILPCLPKAVKKVKLELLRNGSVVRQREEQDRFFLFGNVGDTASSGTIAAGTYTIRASINGVVQPKPVTFTLAGTCVP